MNIKDIANGLSKYSQELEKIYLDRKMQNVKKIVRGTVTRYSVDGTVTEFVPEVEGDAQSNWQAFVDSVTGLTAGDHVYLDQKERYEMPGLTGVTISTDEVKISGGLLARPTANDYQYFIRFSSCRDFVLENMTIDGESGLTAPTGNPPMHQFVNGNTQTAADFVQVNDCLNGVIRNCNFVEVIANTGTLQFESGLPQYPLAYAIDINGNCRGIRVEGCNFLRNAYAGVRDQGYQSVVSNCVFNDSQWHGYVFNGGSGGNNKLEDCHFTRQDFTTMGYTGTIDVNPGSGNFLNAFSMINCTTDFPYDIPTFTAGIFMAKLENIEQLTIKNCNLQHGKAGSDFVNDGENRTISFQGGVRDVSIVDTNLAGGIWHITWDSVPYNLYIENCVINEDNLMSWSVLSAAKKLIVKNSEFNYRNQAFPFRSPYAPAPGEFIFESTNCTYVPSDLADSQIVLQTGSFGVDMHPHVNNIKFAEDNQILVDGSGTIHGGISASGNAHNKADSPESRLGMTSMGETALVKCWDSSLTGSFSHPDPDQVSGALTDPLTEYFPDFSGFPCMEIQTRNWTRTGGSPGDYDEFEKFRWDTVREGWLGYF